MTGFSIFIVRLILGLAFGVIIARVFRPEWSLFQGAGLGVALVAIAYILMMIKKKNAKP